MKNFFDWKKSLILYLKNRQCTLLVILISVMSVRAIPAAAAEYAEFQQAQVSGVITDASTGEAMPGVNIQVKGTTIGTISDNLGKFILKIPDGNSTLVFSFIGYETQEIPLNGRISVSVGLKSDMTGLDEVVVIGYGSLNKKELSSSIVSVNREDFVQSSITNPMQLVVGKVAGLVVNETAAANPNEDPSLQIRGATSLSAGNEPLIVINNVPGGDLKSIAPQDIESITVLKDGASAAIYGTRASNGVILITTKQGAVGSSSFKVTYDSWFGVSLKKNLPRVLTGDEFRQYRNLPDYGANTDWYRAIMNDLPYDNNQYINFSGSAQNGWYNASLNYKDSKGLEIGNSREEYGGLFNMMQRTLNGKIEFTGAVNLRKVKRDNRGGSFGDMMGRNPTLPIYNEDGTFWHGIDPRVASNPIQNIYERINFSELFYLRSNVGVKMYLITKSNTTLSTAVTGLFEQNTNDGKSYTPSTITLINNEYAGRASLSNSTSTNRSFDWVNNYTLKLPDHDFKVVAGYTYQDFGSETRSMNNSNFSYDDFLFNDIGTGTYLLEGKASMDSNKSLYKLIATFGRINYNWNNIIFASTSIRYEGSTKFGKNNKWGSFPAASVAWEMANMDFIKSNLSAINSLKVRASYGVTGRSGFNSYQSIATYSSSGWYLMGDKWIESFRPSRNPNPNLRWEKGINSNFGVDFELFNSRINGSIDYFIRQSKDLLYTYNASQPPMIHPTILVNVGTVVNRGYELTLRGDIIRSDRLNWNSTLVASTGKTFLKSLSNEVYGASYLQMYLKPTPGSTEYFFRYVEGGEIGRFYFYKHAGFTDDGLFMVYDQEGNKIVKGNETDADKQFLGSGVPKVFLSWNNNLRYGKFDLNIFFTSALKFDIFSMLDYDLGFSGSVEQDNVLYKAYTTRADITGDSRLLTSYHLNDGSYLKLENVTLGYTTKFRGNYVHDLRVFVSAKNVYTFTAYEGHDPSQVSVNGLTPGVETRGSYPEAVQLSLGITLNF